MVPFITLCDAEQLVATGHVLAYPTESMYGLGCDPWNQDAVCRLLEIKHRPMSKGLIVLIHDWSQLASLITPVPDSCLAQVKKTWPGPVTWVFPKARQLPYWLTGDHETIAIRMTAHPVARALCLKAPIVSTSANITHQMPARDHGALLKQFSVGLGGVVEGSVGEATEPSMIIDVISGVRLR